MVTYNSLKDKGEFIFENCYSSIWISLSKYPEQILESFLLSSPNTLIVFGKIPFKPRSFVRAVFLMATYNSLKDKE